MNMDFKEMMIQYLFYYNHTVCGNIDIEEDINTLAKDLSLFPNRKKMPSETDGIYNLLACAC